MPSDPRKQSLSSINTWSRAARAALVVLFVLVCVRASPAWAGPGSDEAATPDEARVAAVRVELKVWRGGDAPPGRKRVARRRAEVEGRAVYELQRPAEAGQLLVLLDYAEVLHDEPHELDEIAISTYVAGAFERAKTTINAVSLADGTALSSKRAGSRRDLVIELQAGAEQVIVDYRVEVPHRYWPLGCVWRRCSLSGAVAPLPSEPAVGGVWLPSGGRVVTPVEWTTDDVRFGAVPSWIPGTKPSAEQDKALAGQELIVTREAIEPRAPIGYPSIFWGPRWHHTQRWHRGVKLRVLHISPRPGAHYPDEHILHPIRDVAGHALAISAEVLDIAVAIGIEPPPDAELTIVQGPIRSDVSMFHPTAVMVSDQYLELLATERFAKFHDVQFARTISDTLGYSHFSGHHDPSTDLWLTGSLGVALAQLWQHSRELRDEYAVDVLASLTFVPAIDSFLYTGQASFSSAYFRGSEDLMPVRTHPLFFASELPTGRRIHEKLADLLADDELAKFYATMIADPESDPVAAAERAWGRELGWFFDQWLGRYPDVDYSVASLESKKLDDGRWRHEITVIRDGDRPLVEPIQLYAIERGGEEHYMVWNGEAEPGRPLLDQPIYARHRFVLETDRKLDVVRLDPRARLLEVSRTPTSPVNRGDNNDPLFNNRRPGSARFIYTGIGLSVAASELATAQTSQARINAITAFFAFEASLRRDLRRTGNFLIFTDPETNVGGSASMSAYFGQKRNRQSRRLRLRVGASVAWLNQGGLDRAGGVRTIEMIRLTHDTRKFLRWPSRGHLIGVGVAASQTVRTDGSSDHRYAVDVDFGWAQQWPLAHHHVLATLVEASVVVPLASRLEFRSLNRGGGIGGLSGFTSNELFGRAVARALVEYRHVILDDLRFPVLNLIFIRSIGGALFGGVSTLSACDSYAGWFGRERWYGQVGYGLSARLQWFGVLPQFFRIDAAVPIGRRSGQTCLGEVLPDYLGEVQGIDDVSRLLPAFNINVTFNQPF